MTEDIPAPAEAGTEAVYVYAVCRAEEPPDLTGPVGLTGDNPLRPLAVGPALMAVVQTVRAADFTDEAWQARLADEPELERYARAHHEVVCAVASRLPTVPLPLATLYHDEQRARAALGRESRRFNAALERTANHSEWGVKVYVTGAPAREAAEAAEAAPRRPAAGAGRAYLDRKRSLRDRRERHRTDALRIADAVDADVSALATASRRLPPHGGRIPDERRTQVLNATYLVAEERSAELARLARNLRERTGAQVELSGPWVPYSFVGEV